MDLKRNLMWKEKLYGVDSCYFPSAAEMPDQMCRFSTYRSSADKESKKGAPRFAFFCKYDIFYL